MIPPYKNSSPPTFGSHPILRQNSDPTPSLLFRDVRSPPIKEGGFTLCMLMFPPKEERNKFQITSTGPLLYPNPKNPARKGYNDQNQDNFQKRHRHFPTSPDTSGIVGNCREMSGIVRNHVGECREMSVTLLGGDLEIYRISRICNMNSI